MNTFYLFFLNGSSEKVYYPLDWTMEDILKVSGADEIMFVCEVSL